MRELGQGWGWQKLWLFPFSKSLAPQLSRGSFEFQSIYIHVVWPLQCLMVTSCRHAQFIKAVQFYSKSSVCHNPRIPSTRQEITESSISLDMYISCCMFCFILQFSPPKTWKAVLSIVIYSCIMESSSEAFYG